MMRAHDVRPIEEPVRHGAYVLLGAEPRERARLARAPVPTLAARLGLQNEFAPGGDHPREAIAFLRRVAATPAAIEDRELLTADAIVHVAAPSRAIVRELCAELARLLAPAGRIRIIGGVVRSLSYTGDAMHNFAYAHRVLQQPGAVMPNAFLVPMSKTAEWWSKGWMERHTHFLPRYDDRGRMLAEGHALAAEAGISCLLRRTYKAESQPAPPGEYDFASYFECTDADVPTFHQVCASLRDINRNPEWRFVREGPTWHGRRVASWAELFD